MKGIYLVLNLQGEVPLVVNICSTQEKALGLATRSFLDAKKKGEPTKFGISTVSMDKEIMWDCYNNEHYCE